MLASLGSICENVSNRDPIAKVTQRIDFVRKDETLAGVISRAKRDPSRQAD
jgi:hypothetical protein